MIHNTVKGSFGIGGYAGITVRYPVGAVCTCSLGGVSLTSNGSGLYTFFVPYAGNWNIQAVSGTLSAQSTVAINNLGDNKYVELAFDYSADLNASNCAIYINNSTTSSVTINNGIVSIHANTDTFGTLDTTAGFYFTNKMRLDGYAKIRVHVLEYRNSMSKTGAIAIVNTPVTNVNAADTYTTINGVGWFELNVEEITGDYYVQIAGFTTGGSGYCVFSVDVVQFIAIEEA